MFPYICEFVGMFMLILLGNGVVANVTLNKSNFKGGGLCMPGPNNRAADGGSESNLILTGIRCVILTKLPVAFSAGNREK